MKKMMAALLAGVMVMGLVPAAAYADEPIKVALVYSGVLGDKGYNDLAHAGAERARADFNVEVTELESNEAADWELNFVAMADAGYDLVIGVSSQFHDIMMKHCPEYPDVKFAMIDGVCEAGDNVVSTMFAQNESSFIAGAVCAMMTSKTELEGINEQATIGWVGGMDIPVLQDFFIGFEQGAKYINPEIEVLQSFVGNFSDMLKAKELAAAQISQGADVINSVMGVGPLEAVNEAGVYGIGIDTNMDGLYPGHIVASTLKHIDNCVYQIIESVVNGTFEGGTSTYMDLAHDGVGMTDFSVFKETLGDQFPQDIVDKVEELTEMIISGEIVVDNAEGYGNPNK